MEFSVGVPYGLVDLGILAYIYNFSITRRFI